MAQVFGIVLFGGPPPPPPQLKQRLLTSLLIFLLCAQKRGLGGGAIKNDSKKRGPFPIYSLHAYAHPFLSLQKRRCNGRQMILYPWLCPSLRRTTDIWNWRTASHTVRAADSARGNIPPSPSLLSFSPMPNGGGDSALHAVFIDRHLSNPSLKKGSTVRLIFWPFHPMFCDDFDFKMIFFICRKDERLRIHSFTADYLLPVLIHCSNSCMLCIYCTHTCSSSSTYFIHL